jgi:hypothetical protein
MIHFSVGGFVHRAHSAFAKNLQDFKSAAKHIPCLQLGPFWKELRGAQSRSAWYWGFVD